VTVKKTDAPCRHCGAAKVNRPRGLCWTCYYAPGVKDRYPSESPNGRRGSGNGNSSSPLAPTPCPHPVGSEERIEEYARRAARGEAICHPLDSLEVETKNPSVNGRHHGDATPYATPPRVFRLAFGTTRRVKSKLNTPLGAGLDS
jgi:hypothetical protein